ncbi:hypothetical protein EIP91_001252 [Steccherinum ochraceum]|uniref:Asteroid domain-containing protein n=1 Tax=Steccherinum ochraceum TaxID=92696 RepID=A0A4R0RHB7_9APHY|nr:hypothetical protein EIP91_001252 [Steccherinum ochraceum]
MDFRPILPSITLRSRKGKPSVFNGWSFIYEIVGASGLPWVYGGEYEQFAKLVEATVRAWLDMGLKVHFVFDGPYPALKFPTISSRVTQTAVQGSLLFFRTSAASRSRPRFLNELSMLPPLSYPTCVQTLARLAASLNGAADSSLQLHFADVEGDPFSVELAGRLEAYVVGYDSDFVILNTDGYKGYIPIGEMVWTALTADEESVNVRESDGEFQTVVSKTRKRAQKQRETQTGLIPPESGRDLHLSVTIYSPARLATHLKIPISLLPLLGALVGNDFTGGKDTSVTTSQQTNLQWLFFERQLTLSQRVTRVATTLRSILDAALLAPAKGKQKIQVNSVMQLIERAVATLTVRSTDTLSSGERERIVERIVEATLQYAIPKQELPDLWISPLCPLHAAEDCVLVKYLSSPSQDTPDTDSDVESRGDTTLRDLYIAAYREGDLDPRILDVVHTGTFWYRQSLENPDYECVGRTIARPIHEIVYALLDDAFDLPGAGDDESSDDDESDDDELIDVVEESDEEDPLAPLRGALQQLDDSVDDVMTEPSSSVASSSAPRPSSKRKKVVTEYLRRGTRMAPEEILVPSISSVCRHYDVPRSGIPLQLQSEEARFTFILRVLRSDLPAVRSLPPSHILIALALRWTVFTMDLRAKENSSKERVKERWTKHEAKAFLASFRDSPAEDVLDSETLPSIVDRNVQLVAQTFHALTAILRLSQVLLLQKRIPFPDLHYSGQLFHAFLTNAASVPSDAVSPAVWNAAVEGLDDAFAESEKKKRKKDVTSNGIQNGHLAAKAVNGRQGKPTTKGRGMFDMLASMDA